MDRFYYDLIDAAFESPDVEAFVWGPGYQGWNISISPNSNVFNRFTNSLDFVYQNGFPSGILPFNKTLSVIEVGDLTFSDIYKYYPHPNQFNITIGRYMMEPSEVFAYHRLRGKFGEFQMQLFASNPDCAGSIDLYPKNVEKKVKFLNLGAVTKEYYPLRYKVQQYMASGELPEVKQYLHPGYSFKAQKYSGLLSTNYTVGIKDALLKLHNKQRFTYAQTLSEAEICIFDSSAQHKLIRKFSESLTAGCVPATDVPFEIMLELRDIIIVLDPLMSPAQMRETLYRHLNDTVDLRRRATIGKEFAQKVLSCDQKLSRLLYTVDLYLLGHRGYFSPFGFLSSCLKRYRADGTHSDVLDWHC